MQQKNGRKSSNLVKSHEVIGHFIRGYLVSLLPYSRPRLKKNLFIESLIQYSQCIRKQKGNKKIFCSSVSQYVVVENLLISKKSNQKQCDKAIPIKKSLKIHQTRQFWENTFALFAQINKINRSCIQIACAIIKVIGKH